jgi:hypothetical protein
MLLGRSGDPIGNAYIIPLESEIDAKRQNYIPIYYYFPTGTGDSINECSALVKPFRRLIEEGKPIGKTAFVFYREGNLYYVLGSFAFTERIIFFPGLSFSRVVHTPDGRGLANDEIDNVEHMTLEKNLIDWHVRLVCRNKKYTSQKTRRIKDNVFLWFVMAIPNCLKLEPMPKTQAYKLVSPHQQDLERRRELMLDSVECGIFPVTEMNYSPAFPHFLNFEVSSGKSKELDLPEELFVMPPPSSTLEKMKGIRSKSIDDFCLKNSMSISIRTSKIKGYLKYDGVYFSGGGYL